MAIKYIEKLNAEIEFTFLRFLSLFITSVIGLLFCPTQNY